MSNTRMLLNSDPYHINQLTKTNWHSIKTQIQNVNPTFYELIESLTPIPDLPLYLANYGFGAAISHKNIFSLPNQQGTLTPLSRASFPEDVFNDLNYGSASSPLGIVLNNTCEECYQDDRAGQYYSISIQDEGTIFNQEIIFNENSHQKKGPIATFAGAKSLFMLPYIGCQTRHSRLANAFQCVGSAPKLPNEHGEFFTELITHCAKISQWSATLLFFSHAWVEKIKNDPKWILIKLYFSENQRQKLEADIYNKHYNDLFMRVHTVNRYKPTPYLVDTAKYIFRIIMKKGIGFKPATNEKMLPLRCIQEAYDEYYQLAYTPTIMIPGLLAQQDITYYSLQQPSQKINTYKNKMNNSTYRELVALKKILLAYLDYFQTQEASYYDGELYQACREISFDFFHNKPSDPDDQIRPSSEIITADSRYAFSFGAAKSFSIDAKFFRGCIQLTRR